MHEVDKHVGERIRQLRWARGLTQQELAARAGVKFQQVQKYETGMNRVSASRLWMIADALGVEVKDFFDGLDGKSGEPLPQTRLDGAFARKMADLNEAQRASLMSVVDAFKGVQK